jgi:hypothetical protein
MTTYSFIQYDVLKNVMYFKGTPDPGLKDILTPGSTLDPATRDILESLNSNLINSLDSATTAVLIDFLESIPEINLSIASYVTLTIEIIDDTEIGDVSVVAVNTDKTKTYATKSGKPLAIGIDYIKPKPKWPTMAKCKNCLKFTFDKSNRFNFQGNISGEWDGTFRNGQKVYYVYIPDFSSAATFGTTTEYKIFWRPNVTYSGTDYNGQSFSIANQHKWICTPSASIGTPNELSNNTFFHVLSMFSASCAYTPPPNTWYNYFGNKGFFLLETVTQLPEKPCPKFSPTPGDVNWGWNCGCEGCVSAPSGSIGVYSTLAQCQENCQPCTGSGWNCTSNGCVAASFGSTGSFATLAACQSASVDNGGCCEYYGNCPDLPTYCECDPDLNIVSNPGFSNGVAGWGYTPGGFTPNVGGWGFGNGAALASVSAQLDANNTSAVSLTKYELLTPSCSYSVCFQAWQSDPSVDSIITLGYGQQLPIQAVDSAQNLTTTPTAFNFTITAGSPNLSFYFGVPTGSFSRISIDNICVTLLECPPQPDDCTITGSAYCFDDVEYSCICPAGYYLSGSVCVETGSIAVPKIVTGQTFATTPVQCSAWGWGRAVLYHQYGTNGICPSSLLPGNQSPFFGNPSVYNTQFTFDILRAPFWYATGYTNNGMNPSNNLANNNMADIQLSNTWMGGGSFLDVTSSKTMYAALIGDDVFRLRLNGSDLVATSPSINSQHIDSRTAGINPYINLNLSPVGTQYSYHCWHVFPITLPAGCNTMTLEAKDQFGSYAGFAGFIFDNTATEIVNANNLDDLNIFWQSSTDIIYNFSTVPITASCPPGTDPLGPSPCDDCMASGSQIPCGDCIDCTNGTLYNGYVLDRGGYTLQGRGPGGIVNDNLTANNTWVVPSETEWNALVTYLNGGTAPANVLITGSLDVAVGGKMKDYTRDTNATCWELPNVGAQTDANNSGWSGVAGGKRDNSGTFSGLGLDGVWWSANSLPIPPASNITKLATRELKHWTDEVYRNIYTKNYGCSIRLVRPAVAGETNGNTIFGAYVGNDGTIYDGIVIGNQVWITKNLSETLYNDATSVTTTPGVGAWNSSINTAVPTSCFYNNLASNQNILQGLINPLTGLCYEYPAYYIFQECGGSDILIQTEAGATTTPGEIQKDADDRCWQFVEEINYNPTINATIYHEGNYFTNNTVYENCEDCNAIHTMYVSFTTKTCS